MANKERGLVGEVEVKVIRWLARQMECSGGYASSEERPETEKMRVNGVVGDRI